ncbi:MAG: hypothetical protein GY865_12960 [candidate division Zixibacteria bacterium]|nr:hypothetical protein [candidate division Zixibacteria bacterium]
MSTRDIQLLCDAYFSGNDDMREQVHAGNINWTLKMLKKNNASGESILSTLDRLQELMNTINTKDNETFDHKMLHYLDRLLQRIQGVYAQCRKTGNAPGSLPRGEK